MVELNHISHSQIQLWDRCPRQWEYRYMKLIPSIPSGELVLGGAYHAALDFNFKQKIDSREDLSTEECLDMFAKEWGKRVRREESVNWGKKDPDRLMLVGLALVEEYIDSTAPTVQPLFSERTFRTEVAGIDFIYIMDLQDENKIVIDHKTAGRPYIQLDVDKDLQASAAAFVLGRSIVFHNHVAVKVKIPYIQIVKTIRVAADIEWWIKKVSLTVEHMMSGIAPPNIDSWLCNPLYCSCWDMCRGELTRRTFG